MAIGLKPGDLVLVKADAFQGKRKIKDRWEDKPHEVVHQIVTDIPSYEVKDQLDIQISYITTSSSMLHQKLVFPYVWLLAKHGMDVPVPPQSSVLQEGVTARQHHEMMAWQSPSIRLGRLLWGGSMGSYGFSHEHQPEYPLKMGEDSR